VGSRKIIVVDDERMIAEAIGRVLSRAGHEVSIFSSSLEALAEMQKSTFDVAILDLLMSELNGEELLDWLTANKPNTKVLIMTAYGDIKLRQILLEKGAKDVLAKPFEDIFAFASLVETL
jgi:DNA-binding NtrC family response regulator